MSSVVVTGTGLLTAAGLGHEALAQSVSSGQPLARERSDGLLTSPVSRELIAWPEEPEWQAVREYAGLGSQLAVAVCRQALGRATAGAQPFNVERGATIAVAGDDWTEQQVFDRALATASASKDEARQLFSELEDQFLLRTFRWGIGFGLGSVTGFQGPSVGIDSPSFGGLAGLRHALDLIESGEADAVMLVGVDTTPRLDVVASLERAASESHEPALCFGQGAAALMLERSSSAVARGVRPLAVVDECRLSLDDEVDAAVERLAAELSLARRFSSCGPLGLLLNAGALVDVCLASHWLENDPSGAAAFALTKESFGARGVGLAVLRAVAGVGQAVSA